MTWFTFRQNNSGGSFMGPAYNVYIEAVDIAAANAAALRVGLYFGGCSEGRDCSCCGDRWDEACEWSETSDEMPSHVSDTFGARCCQATGVPLALYVYADGTTREVRP